MLELRMVKGFLLPDSSFPDSKNKPRSYLESGFHLFRGFLLLSFFFLFHSDSQFRTLTVIIGGDDISL